MRTLSQIVESVDLAKPETIQAALTESIGDTGVKAGGSVAVLFDPTYPYDGQKGTVVSVDDKCGVAKVKFPNGAEVNLQSTLLVPL